MHGGAEYITLLSQVKQCHEAGAKLTVTDANGFTALHHAARLGKHEVVEYLVAHCELKQMI